MGSSRRITIVVLAASLGVFSAVALAACSEDDVTGNDAEEQVSVALREFDISPERVEVAEGEVEFVADNEGDRVHELAIRTASGLERTGDIEPGRPVG